MIVIRLELADLEPQPVEAARLHLGRAGRRVRALGRRRSGEGLSRLACEDLAVNLVTREVVRAGKKIELTVREFALLEYLMRHAGRVMSRTLITEYAWDYHFDPGTNIVDVVINRLRKKVDEGFAASLDRKSTRLNSSHT